jgi:prohibitin 2
MSNSPGWKQLQQLADRARKTGGGGPGPRGAVGGLAGFLILGGLVMVGNNALFNVDGGHRAIKYTRIGGVGKEIYSEGMRAGDRKRLRGIRGLT